MTKMLLRVCRRCGAVRVKEHPGRVCPCRAKACAYAPCSRVFRPLEARESQGGQRYCSRRCCYAARRGPPVDLAGLLAQATFDPVTGCHVWRGRRDRYGYGVVQIDGLPRGAHRAAAVLAGLLDGFDDQRWALHSCDVRACIEPGHLYAGDVLRNTRDAASRGRLGKLSPEQVGAIRADPRGNSPVAAAYGVHRSTVERIRKGQRWAAFALVSSS